MCILCCAPAYPSRPIRRIIRYRNSTSIMCCLATFGVVLMVFVSSQHAQLIPENAFMTLAEQQNTLDQRIRAPSINFQDESFGSLARDTRAITRNAARTPALSGNVGEGLTILDPEIDAYARHTNAREDVSKRAIEGRSNQTNHIAVNSNTYVGIDLGQNEPSANDGGIEEQLGENFFDNSIFNDVSFLVRGQKRKAFDKEDNFLFTDSRPRNVSRQASPNYPWGSHSFGPLEAFVITPHGLRWNAYFYEQTIAVVLEDDTRTVLNCSLLEIIPPYENRAALRALGRVMALVPINLRQMVLLATYCESAEERLAPKPEPKRQLTESGIAPERLFIHASTALMGILPGTVWCGLGDRASRYHQLGERRELDGCCRMHDHCPVKVRAGDNRYGYTNTGFSTVSHCLCDEAFRVCLQKASQFDDLVPVVGNLFFNILGTRCLGRPKRRVDPGVPVPSLMPPAEPSTLTKEQRVANRMAAQDDYYTPRLHCAVPDSDGGCRLWLSNPKSVPLKLEPVRPPFRFQAP